ncbi:type I-F CRISPR-associated helicase Cas3f [uncultured Shewanella sp.]|uniref:type I-F CRISPR-associated helicase Cas3f n=1 Tax=uncultured Shewanella sp. TaxID=173975 RepID=UPI00262FE0C2|nr:type I-F CRISPR-associated helicase Cas3f [uncultured Shewanella sp.]
MNSTEKDLVIKEQFSLNTDVIANLAAIAGFFHDVGKANRLFQIKLGVIQDEEAKALNSSVNSDKKNHEPLRHEWVSLRIFQAFVGLQSDQQWLQALVSIDIDTAKKLEQALPAFQDSLKKNVANPFETLPPVAKMVAWLIVSHHRLPQFPKFLDNQPSIESVEQWQHIFEPCWNSPQALGKDWSQEQIAANWQFPLGTPLNSSDWQKAVSDGAKRSLQCQRLFSNEWHNNLFTQHLARLSLMLADHGESSRKDITNKDSDRNYLAFANTDKDEDGKRYLKQKLDEHNINVGKRAYNIACELAGFKLKLNTLGKVKALETPVPKQPRHIYDEFSWQDKAVKLATSLKETVEDYGFFGISMASTGKGKTRANAKIMYALSEPEECRFNVALGLRTLSIQTAKALRKDLFAEDLKSQQQALKQVALLVGSQAVRDLQQIDLSQDDSTEVKKGSESAESLLKDEVDLLSEIDLDNLASFSWLKHDPKILKLLHAPILVSTIDYLIPATEGIRGGRQIAPMLRLLTSDLVLDEPDDFGSPDFHALCRLVNWAGMLGSKVLISTATIMPCEAEALFEAYQQGRLEYTKANGDKNTQGKVCCAWFDECNKPRGKLIETVNTFASEHQSFVFERDKALVKNDLRLRQAKLVDIDPVGVGYFSQAMATRIHQSVQELHLAHAITLADKKVSIGLVRMANINPLVQVAKYLFATAAPANTRIHYCVYHGQYPLLQRTAIEQMLDKALKRHDVKQWSQDSGLAERVEKRAELNHIFIVLATSVAEVGRDHDYDWAVVEPSSMRSIIQLAGRVQRHRKQTPTTYNIHVLSQNYKGLKKGPLCFEKPGFETKIVQCASTNLTQLNVDNDLKSISASPRILYNKIKPNLSPEGKFNCFSEVEHFTQKITLYGMKPVALSYAARWWQHDVSWCGEMQRLQPFRRSHLSKDFSITFSERTQRYLWQEKVEGIYPTEYKPTKDIEIPNEPFAMAYGNNLWHQFDLDKQVKVLAEKLGKSEQQTLAVYTHVSLQEYDKETIEQWIYQAEFGIYKLLTKDECNNDK